jgi:hypothetical protein
LILLLGLLWLLWLLTRVFAAISQGIFITKMCEAVNQPPLIIIDDFAGLVSSQLFDSSCLAA